MKAILLSVLVVSSSLAYADSPYLVSPDGKYLGNLNSNQFDPNSVSNQFGRYGSQFSPDSINNQFGTYDHNLVTRAQTILMLHKHQEFMEDK